MMKQRPSAKALAIPCGAAALALSAWTIWGNTALTVTPVTVSGRRIPAGFSEYRIAHLSDLHNAEFGKGNAKLLNLLAKTAPNIIVITGDLVDSRHTDLPVALDFVREAVKIAPVYYVPGNHEARLDCYRRLRADLTAAGATVLEDRMVPLTHGGDTIILAGLADPYFTIKNHPFRSASAMVRRRLRGMIGWESGYHILLSHRPDLFPAYVRCGVDLAFCGHAHGGQARLPFLGGIIAPDQGLFPKYDAGLYTQGDCRMVVSRGIGNSLCPLRFNNRPEIVVARLQHQE